MYLSSCTSASRSMKNPQLKLEFTRTVSMEEGSCVMGPAPDAVNLVATRCNDLSRRS